MRVASFEWDRTNVAQIEAHDLGPDDVQWLFVDGAPLFRPHSTISGRFIALGFVPDRRFVLVVFEHNKRRKSVRVVTAYEATESAWRMRYEAVKK